jgi:hypothetical protein
MNKLWAILITLFFFLPLTGLGLTSVWTEDAEVSGHENRPLAQRPPFSPGELFSGRWTSGFDRYFTDQFPFRDTLVGVSGRASRFLYITREDGSAVIGGDLDLGGGAALVDAGGNSFLIAGGRIMHMAEVSPDNIARYAAVLNRLQDALPGRRVISAVIPTAFPLYAPEAYMQDSRDQRRAIGDLNDALLDPRIVTADAFAALYAHKDEYLYFRTDHHWTALGAYYAYLSFAEAAGFAPIGIENYIEHAIHGFLGSYGRGTQNRTVRDHPDTLYYYELVNGITFSRSMFVIPQDLSRLSYRVFLGGDHAMLDFTSSNQNGRTLVMVKDSFANALIPWVAPHYERIIIIDPRQYGGSVTRLLGNFEHADLLFMNYVAATAMADFIETINNVR